MHSLLRRREEKEKAGEGGNTTGGALQQLRPATDQSGCQIPALEEIAPCPATAPFIAHLCCAVWRGPILLWTSAQLTSSDDSARSSDESGTTQARQTHDCHTATRLVRNFSKMMMRRHAAHPSTLYELCPCCFATNPKVETCLRFSKRSGSARGSNKHSQGAEDYYSTYAKVKLAHTTAPLSRPRQSPTLMQQACHGTA